MKINLNKESNLSKKDQIASQIISLIKDGELKAGEMLPSIRRLADELNVSVITTKGAYKLVEERGWIYSRQGKGFFVKEHELSVDYLRRASVLRFTETYVEMIKDYKDVITIDEIMMTILNNW